MGLTIFTQGGVVQAGQTLMEIVPRDASQVIVAQVEPTDIDNLQIGQETEVKFTGLRERNPPIIRGRVTNISGDSFTVEETGRAFYRAETDSTRARSRMSLSRTCRVRLDDWIRSSISF